MAGIGNVRRRMVGRGNPALVTSRRPLPWREISRRRGARRRTQTCSHARRHEWVLVDLTQRGLRSFGVGALEWRREDFRGLRTSFQTRLVGKQGPQYETDTAVDSDYGLPLFLVFLGSLRKRPFFNFLGADLPCLGGHHRRRCQLHPNCRRIRQAWTVVYLTPHSTSISSATRRRVHPLVGYPEALGPDSSAAATRRRSNGSSCDFRPALLEVAGLESANCRFQRFTDWRCTPTRRATSASLNPFDSRRAARSRRRSKSLKSRFTGARFPMQRMIQADL